MAVAHRVGHPRRVAQEEQEVRPHRGRRRVKRIVMLLVGAGGLEHAERHLDASAALVESLPLGPGDLVSLLDANEVADPGRVGPGSAAGFSPLTGQGWSEQQAALRQRLAALRARTGAKIAPYSLEKQALS